MFVLVFLIEPPLLNQSLIKSVSECLLLSLQHTLIISLGKWLKRILHSN